MSTINEQIEKFEQAIHDLYKAYRFSHLGLYHLRDTFNTYKRDHGIDKFIIEDPNSGIKMRYTEKEIDEANEHGYYQRIMAGSILATIFNLWEDNFRGKICEHLGLAKKSDLKSDVFGDLSQIRRSVTHNRFNRIKEIDNLKVFGYLFPKQDFILDSYLVDQIVEKVLLELENMKQHNLKA